MNLQLHVPYTSSHDEGRKRTSANVSPVTSNRRSTSPDDADVSITRSTRQVCIIQWNFVQFSVLNDLYFKTTCNIRHFLGPVGGLKIEGPLYWF